MDEYTQKQLDERIRLADYIAGNAGSSITDLFHKQLHNSQKESNDYVSELDKAIESMAMKCVIESYPNDGFRGEENVGMESRSGFEWVVDPIDGTNNYLRGLPLCGFQLAIIYNGETVYGLISRPLLQDRYIAMMGKGAFYENTLTGEKTRIYVSTRKLQNAIGIFDSHLGGDDTSSTEFMKQVSSKIFSIRVFGVAVFDLPAVASGSVEFLVTGVAQKYDIAAGMLLVREAGGMAYQPSGAQATLENQTVVFSNTAAASELMAVFNDMNKK
jgi:fructose-1,6-bisphosphatase/inositol monophosphatase family enzyme